MGKIVGFPGVGDGVIQFPHGQIQVREHAQSAGVARIERGRLGEDALRFNILLLRDQQPAQVDISQRKILVRINGTLEHGVGFGWFVGFHVHHAAGIPGCCIPGILLQCLGKVLVRIG